MNKLKGMFYPWMTKSTFIISVVISLVTLICWVVLTDNIDLDISTIRYLMFEDSPFEFQSPRKRQNLEVANTNGTKTILLWHPIYKFKKFILNEYRKYCPDIKCEITDDRRQINCAHAVIFEVENVFRVPVKYSGQVWIFMEQEAPTNKPNGIRKWNNLFNWTMTYRRDSDLPLFYGGVVKGSSKKRNSSILMKAKKDVLWVTSHCKTPGKRENVIGKLKKSIAIDIYGTCGKELDRCPKENLCIEELYKYTIVAENSNCRDYISEKPFKCYENFTIPMVRGGSTYDLYLPPSSYIDINHFKNAEHLAIYLKETGKNETEYNKYFTYKEYYHNVNTDKLHRETNRNPYCELCLRLFEPEKYSRVYANIHDWWRGNEGESGYMCSKDELVRL